MPVCECIFIGIYDRSPMLHILPFIGTTRVIIIEEVHNSQELKGLTGVIFITDLEPENCLKQYQDTDICMFRKMFPMMIGF